MVYLGEQGNYLKLKDTEYQIHPIALPYVTLHSQIWHTAQGLFPVTGSNIFRNLGLDGLKAQQEYITKKCKGEEETSPQMSW